AGDVKQGESKPATKGGTKSGAKTTKAGTKSGAKGPSKTAAKDDDPDAKEGESSEGFTWDEDEEEDESEALTQARKDAELTASADSVRAYLKQIGKVALLNAEQEVSLAKRIEGGLYAVERMLQIVESEGKL